MKKLMLLAVILLGSQVCWGMSGQGLMGQNKELFEAMKIRQPRQVEFFLRRGGNPNVQNFQNDKGRSLLHYAVELGDPEILSLLLMYGGDVSIKDLDGHTALDVAKSSGAGEKIIRLLEEYDPSLNSDEF